jgi:multimeric flavodoxin WrbA
MTGCTLLIFIIRAWDYFTASQGYYSYHILQGRLYMQVTVLSGSRNREGRTARAIEALCKGVEKADGRTETIFLLELNIERCRQCDADGWGDCRREGRCVIEDDFTSVVDKVKSSDVVVFANPVYFADLSEIMRSFLDRVRRTGFHRKESSMKGIPAVGICLSGGGGGGAPACAANLDRILQMCGFDVVDMILLRRQNLEAKLPVLELTGEWLATRPTSQ